MAFNGLFRENIYVQSRLKTFVKTPEDYCKCYKKIKT